jgi:MFS family permease
LTAPPRLQREHVAPLILVNLGVALHAMIWYMASTMMPSVVADLGSAAFISWATSVYLVTMILGGVAMAPAKARWGARGAMLLASLIVVVGSTLGAAAPSMTVVLAARALQGLGEGLMVALSYALVRELFANALVPKVFGVQAATWGVSIFLGPALGGWLTEAYSWRVAFLAAAAMPLPVMVLGWKVLGHHDSGVRPKAPPAPWLRLGVLAAAVMAITASNRMATIALGLTCVAGGLLLIAWVLAADRRRAPHLFPTSFPGLRHPVSLGLWVEMLMPLAHAPVYVFVPYILQMHRGLSPTMAGYYGAVHAMAWSVSAMLAPMVAQRWQTRSFVLGPMLLAIGLAGTAFSLPAAPLPLLALWLACIGVAFGVCNMYINQAILSHAQKGQEDATSGAIPTLQGLGGAVSAALAGLIGTATGLEAALGTERIDHVVLVMFGGGAVLALLSVGMGWRLRRRLQEESSSGKMG